MTEKEKIYRTLFESSRDAIMMLAPPDWLFTAGNPATIEMFKAKDEKQFVAKGPWELSPEYQPDGQLSSEKARKMIEKVMETGSHFFEWTHKRFDGKEFPATVLLTRMELKGKKLLQATVRDVTERMRAEEELRKYRDHLKELVEEQTIELRESKEQFQSLYENMTLGMYRTTPKGQIVMANPALISLLGYDSFEELKKRNLERNGFDPKYPREKFKEEIKKNGKVQGMESKWKRCDGTSVFIRESANAIKDEKGNIIYYDGTVEDVNERKRAEEALRNSEEKYRILTETVPDIIFTLDRKGRFAYINPAGENIVGYSSQEFLGHDFTEVIAPEYIDTTKDRFKRGLAGEKISLYEVEIMHKDGQKVPVELNMTSLFDEDGNIIGRLGVARDIRESKRVEKMLRESEDRYRTIFENTGTVMAIIEEDKTISLANREAEKLFGYSRKEIEGKKKWTEFIVAEDLEKMKGYHEQRRVDPTSAPMEYEFQIIDKKGSIRDILMSIDVIPGTKISVASVIDITERKKAEEKIKASLKEKEVLLQEIHHRVKNNMQIVISLLRLQSAKAEDKKTQEILRGCQNRIHTMSIIHEKLYQSKDLAKIDYAQYIDGLAVHIFQSYGVDSNLVAVNTDLEEVLLDLNRAIPCGLIINELLSNSVKHAFPEGKKGEICINLHSDKKGMITLVVSDNGIGLPDDIDFRKASSLGLQMVNDLTRQIGGTIKLDRKAGTAFTIKF